MKDKIMNLLKFVIFAMFLLAFGCSDNSTDVKDMVVKVELSVFYENPAKELFPQSDIDVEITELDGNVIMGKYILKGLTNEEGIKVIETNHNILYPNNTYLANAYFANNRNRTQTFKLPQNPNNGNEYLVKVTLILPYSAKAVSSKRSD